MNKIKKNFFQTTPSVVKRSTAAMLCTLLVGLFVAYGCERKEKYDDVTYYDAVGIGYVFMYDSVGKMYPIQGAEVLVRAHIDSGSILSPSPEDVWYKTDGSGKYQVRFIKHTRWLDVWKYVFSVSYINPNHSDEGCYKEFTLFVDEVKNAQKPIVFDTIKFEKKYY